MNRKPPVERKMDLKGTKCMDVRRNQQAVHVELRVAVTVKVLHQVTLKQNRF